MKRKAIKRAGVLVMTCVLLLTATGCWSYRGLNEMEVMTGMAIDKDEDSGGYQVTIETVDLTSDPSSGSVQAVLTESEGVTLFESIRGAKKKLINKLYIGNMKTVIVSEQIARQDGILSVIEFFLRDAEPRETLAIIISKEPRAMDLLSYEAENKGVVSYKLSDVVVEDQKTTGSTIDVKLYQAYNKILSPGACLVLPAFRLDGTQGKMSPEANGIAVFDGDRLMGYLGPDHSRLYLYVTNQIEGGFLSFDTDKDGVADITLEVLNSSTHRSFTYDGSELSIDLSIETGAFLAEIKRDVDLLNEEELRKLKHQLESEMKQQVEDLLLFAKDNFRRDIFDFGQMIYRQDPRLYGELQKDWPQQYMDAKIRVEVSINILNSAFRR